MTNLVENWTGKHATVDAFRLGLPHGLFYVGCCWMLVLGAVMAVERVSPWGRRLTASLGVALIVWALVQETGIA